MNPRVRHALSTARMLLLGRPTMLGDSPLENELQHLSSRIGQSIRNEDLFATERGLELFEFLLKAEVRSRHSAPGVAPATADLAAAVQGSEHELIVHEIRTIIEASSNCAHTGIRDRTISLCTTLFWQMLESRRYAEARSVSGLISQTWRKVAREEDRWTSRDRDSLLLRIREACAFSLPRDRDGKNTDHWSTVCALFAEMAAFAVREHLEPALREALLTFGEVREGPSESRSDGEFRVLRDATLIIVAGWALLRADIDEDYEPLVSLANQALGHLSREETWLAAKVALENESFRSLLRINWWEMEGAFVRGRAGGVIRIDGFIRMAAVLAFARAHVNQISVPEGDPDGTFGLLSNALDSLTSTARFERLIEQNAQLDVVRTWIQGKISEEERLRGVRLAEQTLSPGKVQAFRNSFVEEYLSGRSLVEHLATPVGNDGSGNSFGINSRMKKWWFVDNKDVYADPADLGRNFARALRRGEEKAITSEMLSVGAAGSVSDAENVKGTLVRWMLSSLGEGDDVVVLSNSWRAMRKLDGDERVYLKPSPVTVDISGFTCLLYQVYEPTEPFIAIVGLSGGLRVETFAPKSEPQDGPLISGRLHVGVRQLRPDESRSILEQDPNAQPQQEVVIRALEGLHVEAGDPALAAWWTLPDSLD